MAVGVTGSALVPLHNRERLFPGFENVGGGLMRFPRAAVHDEQHRVGAALAANANPLLQAAEFGSKLCYSLAASVANL
jgi:hypothetical protein